MNDSVRAYWEKSKENLAVSENARNTGSLNAAASRYYYAFVLAGYAVLELENIRGQWESHSHLISQIAGILEEKDYGEASEIYDALDEACTARTRADYDPFPVFERHLTRVLEKCAPIWEAFEIELK